MIADEELPESKAVGILILKAGTFANGAASILSSDEEMSGYIARLMLSVSSTTRVLLLRKLYEIFLTIPLKATLTVEDYELSFLATAERLEAIASTDYLY